MSRSSRLSGDQVEVSYRGDIGGISVSALLMGRRGRGGVDVDSRREDVKSEDNME